jgi:hypothetical protein
VASIFVAVAVVEAGEIATLGVPESLGSLAIVGELASLCELPDEPVEVLS